MRYCQGTKCHEYKTKDRIRGTKGKKSYQTRRRTHFYYGKGNFCSLNCQNDWLEQNIEQALNHLGRTTQPKKVMCDDAWYKDYTYNYDHINNRSDNRHYFVNDLLGQRIPITRQQFNNKELIKPNNLSQ
jgi:hypothetical protein|tara:strand:+ start:200 stop:586 length:387 start_codon:yes stop_codon:yes gene_type:complete